MQHRTLLGAMEQHCGIQQLWEGNQGSSGFWGFFFAFLRYSTSLEEEILTGKCLYKIQSQPKGVCRKVLRFLIVKISANLITNTFPKQTP